MENKDKNENELINSKNENSNEAILNQEKLKEEKDKVRMAIILAVFIGMMFLIGGFITIFLAVVISKVNNSDYTAVINCLSSKDYTKFSPSVLKACATAQGYGNLISYAALTMLIIVLMKDTIINDFKKLKTTKIGFIGFLAGAGFLATAIIIEALVGLVADNTLNQASIEMIMKNGGLIPMVICTVFLAPFVEEFVYRKIIFKLTSKYSKLASYILSIVLFSLPHVLSSMSNGITLENVLQLIPYAYAGFIFAVVYDKSEENLFASLSLHFFNNLYSAASVIIYYAVQGR